MTLIVHFASYLFEILGPFLPSWMQDCIYARLWNKNILPLKPFCSHFHLLTLPHHLPPGAAQPGQGMDETDQFPEIMSHTDITDKYKRSDNRCKIYYIA